MLIVEYSTFPPQLESGEEVLDTFFCESGFISAKVSAALVAEWKQTPEAGLEKYCGKDKRRLQHVSPRTVLCITHGYYIM